MTIDLLNAMIKLRKTMKSPEFAEKLDVTIVSAQKQSEDDKRKFEPSHEELKQAFSL